MVPDHLRVPGLDRPVTVSEYAKLKGIREAEVLASIRALKIPGAFFRGQWYVETPLNCEERLAQLRGERKTADSSDKTVTMKQPGGLPPSAPPRRYPNNEQKHDEPERLSQVRRQQQPHDTREKASPSESEVERLRVHFVKSHWRYDRLTPAQQEALISTKEYAERPQPIDYGLSQSDIRLHGSGYLLLDDDLKYREEGPSHDWGRILLLALLVWVCAYGGMLYLHNSGQLRGTPADLWKLAIVAVPASLIGSFYLFGISEGFVDAYRRRRSEPGYLRYRESLGLHELYQSTAQAAAHEAEQAILRKKRSYWAFLDGYAFERATAEVLKKHQFNPVVTSGSADGGIDIEMTRNGLKGVVQCKAHVASVGPHVVRDLYGVIHHCGASFGIIVSRGGFSRGAIDFARDKPILFLDVSDLISMQEGRDVLAPAFSGSSSGTTS
jgi:hypothetical protein